MVVDDLFIEMFEKNINKLNEREIYIIKNHLISHKMTLRELGKELNISPERIRQIESKALKIIRKPSSLFDDNDGIEENIDDLDDYLDDIDDN